MRSLSMMESTANYRTSPFCPCGGLRVPYEGRMVCRQCDTEEAEAIQKENSQLVPSWRGGLRRRDTNTNAQERRERASGEFDLLCPGGARRVTKVERNRLGVSSSAIVLVRNNGETVKLKTNWTESRQDPRFPLNAEPKEPDIRKFDYVVFALVDDDSNIPIVWWPMRPKDVLRQWQIGEDDQCGYVDAADISTFKGNWKVFTEQV